jgi:hypothetical protein
MKMGTTRSPSRCDAVADWALQSVILQRPAILGYASWSAFFPFHSGLTTPDQLLALADE